MELRTIIVLCILPAFALGAGKLILNKKYKLHSSENFEDFMKAIGVGFFTRKIGNAVSPVIELTENNGEYKLYSNSTFKDTVTTFRLGKEFDEETPDGRTVKSLIVLEDGNKLVHTQKGDKNAKIVRVFNEDEVRMVLTVDDIVCTRVYKPLE